MSVLLSQRGLPSSQAQRSLALVLPVWAKIRLSLWRGVITQTAGKSLVRPNPASHTLPGAELVLIRKGASAHSPGPTGTAGPSPFCWSWATEGRPQRPALAPALHTQIFHLPPAWAGACHSQRGVGAMTSQPAFLSPLPAPVFSLVLAEHSCVGGLSHVLVDKVSLLFLTSFRGNPFPMFPACSPCQAFLPPPGSPV